MNNEENDTRDEKMTDEEAAALDHALEAALQSVEAGRVRPVSELLAELRSRYGGSQTE